jgi:hypothetical protein
MTEAEEKAQQFIERHIVTGLVVSTDFIRAVAQRWNPQWLTSVTARTLAQWCLEYYKQYDKAPGRDIEAVYTAKLRAGLQEDKAEAIETVLQSLSDEFERTQFDTPYLLDKAKEYFEQQDLLAFADTIKTEASGGSLSKARELASDYKPALQSNNVGMSVFDVLPSTTRAAFAERQEPLIKFPKRLGRFWNSQFVRDGFIALQGPEKSGKTMLLIEMAMRGTSNGCNVAFFQAGDMSENQFLRRIGIYLSKRSDEVQYCGELYVPMPDCLNSQTGACPRSECDDAPMGGVTPLEGYTYAYTYDQLKEASDACPEYRPCRNCNNEPTLGTVWLQRRKPVSVLTWQEAHRQFTRWGRRNKKRLQLCTYPNRTLTVAEIRSLLHTWERQDGFVPDIVIVDYADLLVADTDDRRFDFRNQQNTIWQGLRRLSQERHCLVITATQAAASSYEHTTQRLSDFSEDHRKYAHATGVYGLNQTSEEKHIGIMRLNELVVREGDFDRTSCVTILQRLQMGRPFLGSFGR